MTKKLIEFGMLSLLALPTFVAAQENGSALKKVSKEIEELQSKPKRVLELNEQLAALNRRMDPHDASIETVLGEIAPYSLPRRIAQYQAERRSRAEEINSRDAQINVIASRIKMLSNGKHDLSAHPLPTDVKPDAEGVAKAKLLVNNQTLTSLGERLKEIAAFRQEMKRLAEVIDPALERHLGKQPPVGISDNDQILLLCLEASAQITAAASSVQRFLYAENAIEASTHALTVTLPRAKASVIRMLDLAHQGRAKDTEQRQQKIQEMLDGIAERLKK